MKRSNFIKIIRLFLLTVSLLGASLAGAADDILSKAEALLREGRAKEAYQLLAPQEFELAGDLRYDYLLGIAALDGGKPDKATLAFERVLMMDANFAGARLDLGRAYFALGDLPRARTELEVVLAQDPPPEARRAAEAYLAAVAQKESAKKTVLTGYMEGVFGHDNNITTVSNDFTGGVQTAYGIAGMLPTGNSIPRWGNFAGANAGVDFNHQVEEGLNLYAGLDGKRRQYLGDQNNNLFDTQSVDVRGGVILALTPSDSLKVGLAYQRYFQEGALLGTANDRHTTGVSGEWRHVLGERDSLGLSGAYNLQRNEAQLDSATGLSTSDINQTILGGNWLHLYGGQGNPLIFASVTYGRDDARLKRANGTSVSKDYYGGRLYGQYSLLENADVFAGVGYQWRNDKSLNARSTVTDYGKDELMDVSLGVNWRPVTNVTVRPQLVYTRNASNIALYAFTRMEPSVTVRYDFR